MGMSMASEQPLHWGDWVGQVAKRSEVIEWTPALRMAAFLDWPTSPQPGDALPPLWHWFYHTDPAPSATLGRDGLPARGGFLPPIPLPRRMWAGGRVTFGAPLRIGETALKTSRVKSIQEKEGRSGKLAFITVEHVLDGPGGEAVREEHDIVYRAAADPSAPARAPELAPSTEPVWRRDHAMNEAALFRYSALTYNPHRIHYDVDYCRSQEGYPGLVVHGPLLATLLADLGRANAGGRQIRQFDYRAVAPVFAHQPFQTAGSPGADGRAELWIALEDGTLAMTASMEFG